MIPPAPEMRTRALVGHLAEKYGRIRVRKPCDRQTGASAPQYGRRPLTVAGFIPRQPMSAELQQSYDTFPYQSFSFPQSHPDRLATIGQLFGMTPPPIAHSRVLEI
jgi:hypothetical protein